MSTVSPATADAPPSTDRSAATSDEAAGVRAPAACHAQLSESSAGWLLTVIVSQEALNYLGTAAHDDPLVLTPGQVTISITPNLVPGEPFALGTLRLVLSDAQLDPAVQGTSHDEAGPTVK